MANEDNVDIIDNKPYESFEDSKNSLTFKDKFKNWTKQNLDYIISASAVIVLIFLCFAINGDLPFGKNSFLLSDSYEQVVKFFNQFYDFFEGKSTLFYTNYFGKGMEIFSTMQYMYLNPFYLIAFLGGRKNLFLMMAFAVMLMFVFNSMIFIWFARKYFKNVKPQIRVILSLIYVFSGFVNYCFSFSGWMIYPALILIVTDRFLNFVKTGKMTSLIFSIIWYVISCYSIGISTMIILVILMVSYIIYFENKDDRKKKLTDLFVVLFVSALASIVILFPSIIAVFQTNRSGSFIKNLVGRENTNIIYKVGVVFLDFSILILDIFYIIKCNKKEKLNKFLLFTAVILFVPVFFDTAMRILCFSYYQCFSSRFYFMNEAFIFGIALLLFDKNLLTFKECKTKSLSKIIIGLSIGFSLLVLIIVECFSCKRISQILKTPTYEENLLTILFFSIFAVCLVILLLAYILNNKLVLSEKNFKQLLALFLVINSIFNFVCLSAYSNREIDKDFEEIIESNDISGNIKFFNTNSVSSVLNLRIGDVRYNSAFSSLISKETIKTFEYFGYETGSTYVRNDGGTLLADSILGLSHYISKTELNRPYLELISKNNGYYLYNNKLTTSGAFVINSEFEFDNLKTIYENLDALKEYFGISGTLFEEVNVSKEIIKDDKTYDDYDVIEINYTATEDGILYINKNFGIENTKTASGEKVEYFLGGRNFNSDLGFLRAGENLKFCVFIEKQKAEEELENLKCNFLNYETTVKLIEKLQENQAEFEYTKDGYIVKGDFQANDNLYVMVPDIDGLNYELNSNKINAENVFGSMVKISLNTENNVLIVRYKYPHLIKWLEFAIIAVLLIAIVLLIHHFTHFKHLQTFISLMMKYLVIAILVVVYACGILISLVWFFV